MRIAFPDKSYVECYKSSTPGQVILVIAATDGQDKNKRTTNAVELTAEEFKKLISDVQAQ